MSEHASAVEPAASVQSDPAGAAEVFYDGACPICRREIDVYRKTLPAEVAWSDVTTLDDSALAGAGRSRQELLAAFHVRRRDGTVVSGARAFLSVWRTSRWLGPLARLLDRQPFLAVLDLAYRGFLAIRPLWRRQP